MSMKSERSTKQLRARVRWFALGSILLLALTAYSLARIYTGAQGSQAQIALAMRQVSEVTWRVKSLEMWTKLSLSEIKQQTNSSGSNDLIKTKAFALSEARALDSLPYLNQVVDPETIYALKRVLKILEAIQTLADQPLQVASMLENTQGDISILVKEAGNLNFESVANLLTDTQNRLFQSFAIASAISLISVTITLALWKTERNLVKKLFETDKTQLETLGALSSGFAHVTQNTLWSLRESLRNVSSNQKLVAKERANIEQALSDIKSLNALNTALTKAAHDPSKDDELRPLSDIVSHVKPIFEREDGSIRYSIDPSIDEVPMPFATSVFVISELLNNALDALKNSSDGHVSLSVRKARKSIAIEVEDTGPGMSNSVRDNCLSPFFTTKSESNGHCGFGLHSIDRLISGLGGQLNIQSCENEGTTVSINIPRGQA